MKIPILVYAVLVIVAQARAQALDPKAVSVGVWRGTSHCQLRPSACRDEVVVYRINDATARDSVLFDARKIVNGQEEDMGVLSCEVKEGGTRLNCPMRNGLWSFTIRRDTLVGELRLPNGQKFRDVRATRVH
jgi:hypothetical protein